MRDPRLDFFRGLALMIIFIAHMPGNWVAWYIPARFGFSDAADMFVFCSGFAAAIAFGGTFARNGMALGSLRIAFRCFTLYIAHLMIFFAVAVICVIGNHLFDDPDYISRLNLGYFFENTQQALLGLFTLHYVPNYFDILPMYLVVLAMVPVAMLLARVHVLLPLAGVAAIWSYNWFIGIDLPAEMYYDRPWFFDPFGWQLIFFTGFALSIGWVKAPPVNHWLVAAALAFVFLSMLVSHRFIGWFPELQAARDAVEWWVHKTDYGPVRWLHFLALAYLCIAAVNRWPVIVHHRIARPLIQCGQQALSVFATSMALSYVAGMALDQLGTAAPTVLLVNVAGFIILYGVARLAALIKSEPWRKPPSPKPTEEGARREGEGHRTGPAHRLAHGTGD